MTKYEEAQVYCGHLGFRDVVATSQLNMLLGEGLKPEDSVLEIGCGCLCAASKIVPEILPCGYVGIEPNTWLVEAALLDHASPCSSAKFKARKPRFLTNMDFDGSPAAPPGGFHFVLSHSILTHCGLDLTRMFMRGVKKSIGANGKGLVSINLGDEDPPRDGWFYPDAVRHRFETVEKIAGEEGLLAERTNYREIMVSVAPQHTHDWIRLKHKQ